MSAEESWDAESFTEAIAESYKLNMGESMEQTTEQKNEISKDIELNNKSGQEMEQLNIIKEENERLKNELVEMKLSKKKELVESIVKLNSSLKNEDLMQESDDMLNLRSLYESKQVKPALKFEGVALVESPNNKMETKEEFIVDNNSITLSESYYKKFNDEIRNRLRN